MQEIILMVSFNYAVLVTGTCMLVAILVWMIFNVTRDEQGNLCFKRDLEEFVIGIGAATVTWIFVALWPYLYFATTKEIAKREMKIYETEFVADCEWLRGGQVARDFNAPKELKCVNEIK